MNKITIQALHIGDDFDDIINAGASDSLFASTSTSATFLATKIDMVMKVNPQWSAETAYGKMDAIPFYSNTSRTIGYNFLCKSDPTVGFSAADLTKNVDKLMKFQYPRYSGPDGFQVLSAAPLFRVSFTKIDTAKSNKGFTLYEQVEGYISGDLEISPGHTGPSGTPTIPVPLDEKGSILGETSFGISFTITVLHRTTPGWTDNQWTGPGFWSAGNAETRAKGKQAAANPDDTINGNRNKTKIA